VTSLDDLRPPSPTAAAQRGYRDWTIIGAGAVILIIVFLLSR
jgi:hypothetical protein